MHILCSDLQNYIKKDEKSKCAITDEKLTKFILFGDLNRQAQIFSKE
jgi:hypothetical protein